MYNTKSKFIAFTILSILCIATMLISALFYVELQGENIFGVIPEKPAGLSDAQIGTTDDLHERRVAYAIISIGFTVSALFFCIAISIFSYYIIATANNRKLIKFIRQLKENFAIKHNVPKEEIDSGLLDIRKQIRKLEKSQVKPINEVEIKKGKKDKKAKQESNAAPQPAANNAFPANAPAVAPTQPLA